MNTRTFIFKHFIYGTFIMFLLCGLSVSVQAQEFLTGIKASPQVYKAEKHNPNIFLSSKAEPLPLLLPFFDDFSKGIGAPNEKFYENKQAFVNQTFPVFPPTIGVVTLDALDEHGAIYSHLNATSKGADTLTSRFIRLDSLFVEGGGRQISAADSIYFSFYFQPGGAGVADNLAGERIGNQPNTNDSLVLEFGYTKPLGDTLVTIWDHIWSTPGFNLKIWLSENPYQYFKQVMIPITEEKYLCENFQFRFRNYASLEPQVGITGWEGNVDQWHIDYIRLNVNRRYDDFFTNDLAFVAPTTSFLQKYQAMPWKQFQNADMKSHFTNQLSNLSDGSRTSEYQYTIMHNGNVVGASEPSSALDIEPFLTSGIQTKAGQASPLITYEPGNLTDTTVFVVTHIFKNAAGLDFAPVNDTCVYEQQFLNYYAYDDGTAEYGYCLNNQFNIAYFAMKFSLRVQDDLSAVRMWFNHTKNDENSNATFSIIVWKDAQGVPGDTIYKQENIKPEFSEQFLDFVEYRFNKKLSVSGDIWIGFEQQGNVQLNIGFDQSNDSREYFKYNTRGKWETSIYKGTPMLRPVFGELTQIDPPVAPSPSTVIGPNPANNTISITNNKLRITKVELYNITGMKMDEKQCRDNVVNMNVANYPTGIYFVRVIKENNTFETFKLIKN
ncbi:MAG: T9SS type A sorting domain-containing protein [Lentimicrobiaceae bacterium]|nr:T9SS type A sorting domain-containing protein [Lentimicrobiaceae bacterium]